MKIVALAENTCGQENCIPEHGLSFYIETSARRILMDTGPSDVLLKNAEAVGVDLSSVDLAVISHAHYDHTGGLPAFAGVNPGAPIFMQQAAAWDYFSEDGDGKLRYSGMDPQIFHLPQAVWIEGNARLGEDLFLFSGIGSRRGRPASNLSLWKRAERTPSLKESGEDGHPEVVHDDFRHEQCLVIREDDRQVLLSGCAHHGILNILDRHREIFGRMPDFVISGFHMMKKDGYTEEDLREIRETAEELRKCPTVFYTCHCTGLRPYEVMRAVMGDQLKYIHCGETVRIG